LLDNFWSFWVIALVVLFAPELRRALASLGQGRVGQALLGASGEERAHVTDEIVSAVVSLSGRRIGALLVVERSTGLRQYAELGVPLDAQVSADLLVSVFLPYSPLHDGAVFIQGTRIALARAASPPAAPGQARLSGRAPMLRRLVANWELKILSVVIAFALWLVVVGSGKSQLATPAIVEYTGLGADLVLVGRPRDSV